MGTIAERIRWILKHRGWSQRQLADASKLTPTGINSTLKRLDINDGAIEVETVRRIAEGAHVSYNWLLTGLGSADEDGAPSTSDDDLPEYHNAPGWADAVAAARVLRPDIHDLAFEKAGHVPPEAIGGPVSAQTVIELALVALKFLPGAELARAAQQKRAAIDQELDRERDRLAEEQRAADAKKKRAKPAGGGKR